MNMSMVLVCVCFMVIVIVMAVIQYLERKDLYTRIMSRNLAEYKNADKNEVPRAAKSAHKTTLERWRKVNVVKKGE